MTPQEAIEYAKGILQNGGNVRKQEFVKLVVEALEKQIKYRWRNCDDELPEKGEVVQVIIYGHYCIVVKEDETIEQALDRTKKMERQEIGFIGSDGWYGYDGYPMIIKPVKWKPIDWSDNQ